MGFSVQKTSEQEISILVDALFMRNDPQFQLFEKFISSINSLEAKLVSVDLSSCKYMDTKALALIIRMHQELKKKDASMRISGADEDIKEFLNSIQLDKIIPIS